MYVCFEKLVCSRSSDMYLIQEVSSAYYNYHDYFFILILIRCTSLYVNLNFTIMCNLDISSTQFVSMYAAVCMFLINIELT